jgi:hypothetical protein
MHGLERAIGAGLVELQAARPDVRVMVDVGFGNSLEACQWEEFVAPPQHPAVDSDMEEGSYSGSGSGSDSGSTGDSDSDSDNGGGNGEGAGEGSEDDSGWETAQEDYSE